MENKLGLTPNQKDVYDFLRVYHKQNGVFPTLREIMKGEIEGRKVISERRSTRSAFNLLRGLEERGWIKTAAGKSRGIELL